jgi:hypothetical protein
MVTPPFCRSNGLPFSIILQLEKKEGRRRREVEDKQERGEERRGKEERNEVEGEKYDFWLVCVEALILSIGPQHLRDILEETPTH